MNAMGFIFGVRNMFNSEIDGGFLSANTLRRPSIGLVMVASVGAVSGDTR